MKYRVPKESNKYYLPKQTYMTAIYYAQQYDSWHQELEAMGSVIQGIDYSKDRVQTSGTSDSTSELAMRREKIESKIRMVDDIIHQICRGNKAMEKYIRLGVCYGLTFWQLEAQKIPCGKDMYYSKRRRFYWLMSRRM